VELDDQLRRWFEGLEAELLPQVRGVGPEQLQRRGRRRRHARWALAAVAAAVLVGGIVLARSWLWPLAQRETVPIGPAPSVTVPPSPTTAPASPGSPTTGKPTTTREPTTTAPPATTAPRGTAGIAGVRWHHDTGRCTPFLRPVINRTWQTSAPRLQGVTPGASVPLWLRNKQAPPNVPDPSPDPELSKPAPDVVIYATVVFPDGSRHRSRPLRLDRRSQEVAITYPGDFPGAPPTRAAGDYTVLWTAGDGFLACDGFQVAR
jgi:eukaryotic-like serine/threonine-protein kinase